MYTFALFSLLGAGAFAVAIPQAPPVNLDIAQIPLTNDQGASLPGVVGQSIKYAVIGIGTQNYTCSCNNTVTNVGATANLYDISAQTGTHTAATFASFLQNQTINALNGYPAPIRAAGQQIGNHYYDPD